MTEHRYDWVPGTLALATTTMVALAALTPYLWVIPKENMNLITQSQTTLWNGWLMILGFYFATSLGARKQTETIDTLARNASTTPDVTLAAGESKTIKAD